jgi:hypothetical protein
MKSNKCSVKAFFVCFCILVGTVNLAYCAIDEAHWSIIGPTAVTFDWRGSDNTIYYGTTSGDITNSMVASPANPTPTDSSGSYWECALTGLSVDTLYYYKIGSSGTQHTFRTPPAPGTSGFTMVATSDWQENGDEHTLNGMKQIAAIAPRFVLVLGDLTGADDNGIFLVHKRFADMMVWSQDAAYMANWGNHDWEDNTKKPSAAWMNNIKGRIAMPNSQTVASSPSGGGEEWGWFDYGNARFITMPDWYTDPTYDEWKTGAEPVFQAAQNDSNIKWIVVLLHRPAYSTGHHTNDGTEPPATQINYFADKYNKFVLCINAHNHVCERSIPSQTHNVLHVCDGSPYLTQAWSMPPQSFTAFRAERDGFLKITFNIDSIQGWFIAADHKSGEEASDKNPGDVVDSWTITPRVNADANALAPKQITLAKANVPSSDTADQIHFTIISNTAVTFDWIGTADSIYYGTSAGSLNNTVVAVHPSELPVVANPWTSNPGPFWEARLTGLQQNTLYYYKIGSSGQVHKFKSPPPAGTAGFRVCSTSDMHDSSTECVAMFNQIAGLNPALVLTTGDTTGGDSGGQEYVDTRFHDAMVWSQDAAWMPIWGNHDWEDNPKSDDLRTLKGRFDIPNAGTVPSSPADGAGGYERYEDWGWFDYGNTRFISWPERYVSSTWGEWQFLAAPVFLVAQNDPNIKFIVTFGHQSAYTSTNRRYPGNPDMQNILNDFHTSYSKYKLDLSGHNHQYERYQMPNGMNYVINSTAGAYYHEKWDKQALTKPSNCAYRAIHYGIVVLDISDTAIQGQFICSVNTTRSGEDFSIEEPVCSAPNAVIDSFTIAAPLQNTNAPTPNPTASAPVAASPTSIDKSGKPNETTSSATTSAMTPPGEGSIVIYSDDFEYDNKTGDFPATWKVLPDTRYIYTSNSTTYTGSRCIKFRGACSMEKVISTAGRSNIHVKYARKGDSSNPYEPDEYVFAEWSADGTTWNLLEKTQETTWALKEFVCSSAADNNPNFRLRFRTNTKGTEKFAFVDSLQVFVAAYFKP